MFQWSHFFSEMEMYGDEVEQEFGLESFNGATSFQKWKYFLHAIPTHTFPPKEVSMEPLLFRNGNVIEC